jgi:hypothetical protein
LCFTFLPWPPRNATAEGLLLSRAARLSCAQAGNKSLLSYNASKGVPGYTGYTPGPSSIGLVVKGFEHTGRPADAATHERLAKQTVDPQRDTQ